MESDDQITITTKSVDGTTWLTVAGEIDMSTAPRFRQAIEEVAAAAAPVCVDMSKVGFIDSTGLAVLVSFERDAPGQVRITRASVPVKRLLEIAGLPHLAGAD